MKLSPKPMVYKRSVAQSHTLLPPLDHTMRVPPHRLGRRRGGTRQIRALDVKPKVDQGDQGGSWAIYAYQPKADNDPD